MPQAIPAAVGWAVTAFTSAATVVNTAFVAGAALIPGLSFSAQLAVANFATKALIYGGLAAGAAAIMRPSVPSSGVTLDFKPDPKAPIVGMMGYCATGGNKVFQATWGYKKVALSLGAALSLGPIDAITQFRADDAVVSFTGPQNEATGFFAADMWQRTTTGLPTDSALLPPTGLKYGNPPLTGWGANNAAPGVAFAFWTMVLAKNPEDRDIFVNGVPEPRWIGRWMKVYDWRKDSTYPGGDGPQREGDWRTWGYSENPYVHARAFLRGHFRLNNDGTLDYTKRIAGVGVPPSAIDMAAFTEGANVADTNAWTISGSWSTSDQKWQVLVSMLQAGGGQPINRGAQVSVLINTPRVSTYTYTRDDMIGQAEVRPLTRRRERKNTIVPRYRSEAHNWEYVAAEDVTATVYRDEDRGEPRSTEIQYTYVRSPKQAAQLAAYDLVTLREGLTITLPSKVHLMHVHAGDCITVNVPDMALDNQKVIVIRTTHDYKNATTTLECRSETDGKHAFALGQAAAPPPSPTLSRVDPYYVPAPIPAEWDVQPYVPPPGSPSQPVIIVIGDPGTGDVEATIVEYGLSSGGPWLSAGNADPATGRYQISGLEPETQYWVSIRYVAKNGAVSDRYISGPYTTAGLVAGDISEDATGKIVDDVLAQIGDIADQAQEVEDLSEALLDDIVNKHHAIFREQELKNEGVAIAYESSRIYTDEFKAEASLTYSTIVQLNNGLAATLNQSQSYTDGQVSSAMNLVYTKAETDAGLATTLNQSKSYTDAYKTEASILFSTKAERADGDAATYQLAKSYTDDYKSEATITFATKAERANGDAATLIQAKSYTDDYKSEANATFAAQSSLNGVSAAASLALSTAQSADGKLNEARVRLVAAASGGQPAVVEMFSDQSGGSYVRFGAQQIGFGDNTVFEDPTDTLVTTIGSVRYITAWGAPFGPDALTYWVGPSSVSTASATKAAAEAAGGQWRDAIGGSFFGGATLSGPFDTGTSGADPVFLNEDWKTIASTSLHPMRDGAFSIKVTMEAQADAQNAQGPQIPSILYRVVSVNESGGDIVVLHQNSVTAPSSWGSLNIGYLAPALGLRRGRRRLLLQALIGEPTYFAQVRFVRMNGLYTADVTSV